MLVLEEPSAKKSM